MALETADAEEEADDDDDDDFADMLAESMLEDNSAATAQIRIARLDAQNKVEAKQVQVAEQEAAVSRAPNIVIKQRHLRRKAELEAELAALEAELASIGAGQN
jgi:hypothetical protein